MTYRDFEIFAKERIKKGCPDKEKDEAALSFCARTLILHYSEKQAHELLLLKEEEIPCEVAVCLENALERLADGEPLQYIIGEWEFYGYRIFCGKGCLIPRPETEIICSKVIEQLSCGGRFLDLCTGSGCISVASLMETKDTSCVSIDISEDALFYARKNADYHNLHERMKIVKADALKFIPNEKFDVIVSNPPYIKSSDMAHLPKNVLCEPHIALDGGEDGLVFYRKITENCAESIRSGGALVFETGYDTADGVCEIVKNAGLCAHIVCDYSGNKRMVVGVKNKDS